jgi:Cu-Zn family superoxide dismutase
MKKFTSKILLALLIASMFVLVITSKVSFAHTPDPDIVAKAQIFGPDITGELKLEQGENGIVQVSLVLRGDPTVLTPGLHGIHIHEKSICEEDAQPRFNTAGGHFDPGPFGNSTPVQDNHPYHLGDLPNIEIDERGEGRLETVTSRITLSQSPVSIFDQDGSAIIVHQNQDEMVAEGTAAQAGGGRLACGVIEQI